MCFPFFFNPDFSAAGRDADIRSFEELYIKQIKKQIGIKRHKSNMEGEQK